MFKNVIQKKAIFHYYPFRESYIDLIIQIIIILISISFV